MKRRLAILGASGHAKVVADIVRLSGDYEMEPYRTLYPDSAYDLPCTEQLTSRLLSLPTGTAVGSNDVITICTIIRLAIDNQAVADFMSADKRKLAV